jgi:hypothetical protein
MEETLIMEGTFFDKRILEKLTREGKSLTFHTIVNNLKPEAPNSVQ